jgi:hypothetical protein
VLFIPSCLGYTGLTGALDRSDRCESLVGFCLGVNCLTPVSLSLGAAGQFLVCLGLFCLVLCRVFLPCRLCFGVVLFQGLEKSLRLSGTLVVRLL